MSLRVEYPKISKNRGAAFWLQPANFVAARKKFRLDRSSQWREVNEWSIHSIRVEDRTRSFRDLLPGANPASPIRVVILGDSGEGDKSQYGLVPLIRALDPHFMIINGDVAYPAGRAIDYVEGFFEPYNDLNIPIWAVPGNHEYYSPNNGREFVDVFCTRKKVDDWSRHGLRFVPQPGTYWELSDPEMTPVRIIGIDSGQSGNLDSTSATSSDARQMDWLKKRLQNADETNSKVILLFHIPVLVDGKINQSARLTTLHRLIAESPSVKVVVCGHTHSFQQYDPAVFASALTAITGGTFRREAPMYFVSGAGGAYLSVPPKAPYMFKPSLVYPDVADWQRFSKGSLWQRTAEATVKYARKGINFVGLNRSVVNRAVASLEEGALADMDKPGLLSLLYLEIRASDAILTPVFLKDLGAIYDPSVNLIAIRNTYPKPAQVLVDNCKRQGVAI